MLLGDLPALRPSDLADALDAALASEHAFVPDADGTGTTLVTARDGASFLHHFGVGSAAAHRDAGFTELPAAVGLRRDVDLPQHLATLGPALGPRTRSLLSDGHSETSDTGQG